jgi:urease accessory protein
MLAGARRDDVIPMIRAIRVLSRGDWERSKLLTDTVVLDYDERHRRRMAMKGKRGFEFLLDLPHAVPIRDRDGLELEDGRIVWVNAKHEALAEISAPDAVALARVAWHLGNRHLPTQLLPGKLRIRRDHVIEAMVAGLGATVTPIEAPFDPETGAYGGHAHAGHTHSHEHDAGALEHDDRTDDEAGP